MALCAAIAAACSAASAPVVALDSTNPHSVVVTVTGLSRRDLSTLSHVTLSREAWTSLLHVTVKTETGRALLPVAGHYDIRNGVIRFTPALVFEPGRPYEVVFNPAALPGGGLSHLQPVTTVVSLPAPPASAATHVAAAYPTGPEVPANLLRMYIEFSGPMGIRTGEHYISILDADGREIPGALLPLDTDLWNPEHTRFTVLFDPGRVKRGILPNRTLGRPLTAGQTFTLVVHDGWPDAQGRPIASHFDKTYWVGPAIERPISPADWRIAAPAAGSRDPLVVTFPWGLDHALLQRTLRVMRDFDTDAKDVSGEVRVGRAETQWSFVPSAPWQPGKHLLIAGQQLEDPAGNSPSRAFEEENSSSPRPGPTYVPFTIQ